MNLFKNWFSSSKTSAKNKSVAVGGSNNAPITVLGHGATLTIMQRSHDYQVLEAQINKARQLMLGYPNDKRFREKHQALLKQAEDFKRDVLKLAEDFNKIPINNERLRLAKQHFEAGEYQAARAILDAETMSHDQDALLAKQQRLDTQQTEVVKQLTDNATEFLLKARLTAIDYSLPDRIAQTSQFFEQALKSAQTPENMFAYAYFLQENNQFKDAEHCYQATLASYCQLATDNPAVYLPYLVNILQNLVMAYLNDWHEPQQALIYLQEAKTLLEPFAKQVPELFAEQHAETLRLITRAKQP